MLAMPPGAKRISSGATFFQKRVFPVLWFGFLSVFTIVALVATRHQAGPQWPILVVPVFMMLLGYFLFKKLLSDLMDEVWDDGYELIVVNDGHVEHVALANIINVSYSGFTNPKRVTLTLRAPCRWGEHMTFMPPMRIFSLANLTMLPLVEDLIKRVDAARRGT